MKQLMLLRHAKSSWDDPMMEDVDRPLNDRGRRAAHTMGAWIIAQDLMPEAIISSASVRTRETCDLLGLEPTPTFENGLYLSSPEMMLTHIHRARCDRLLVVAHNPGIAMLAHNLCQTPPMHRRFHDYPTAALTVLTFDIADFAEVRASRGLVQHFLTPHDVPAL
jgi:phosphohistidine phosphatase